MLAFFRSKQRQTDAPLDALLDSDRAPQEDTAPAAAKKTSANRETIDLLELDLSAMIREVASAVASVRGGASASAEALAAIRARTEALATKSRDAKRDADQVAEATVELAQSTGEIDAQVRVAGSLTNDARDAARGANDSVDGLKASSAVIGEVVKLIANIA